MPEEQTNRWADQQAVAEGRMDQIDKISGEGGETPQLLLSTSGAKMTSSCYRVVVDIPAMAPDGVGEAVFDVVADACAAMEDTHPEIRDRKGWDLGVHAGPVDDRPMAKLERLEERYERLKSEVEAYRAALRADLSLNPTGGS